MAAAMIKMADWQVYILNAGCWSIGGFILGWLVARRAKEQYMEDERERDEDGWLTSRWTGIVMIVGAVILSVGSVIYSTAKNDESAELQAVSTCQANYNRAFAQAVTARSKIQQEDQRLDAADRAAFQTMIRRILASPQDGDSLQAVIDWQTRTHEIELKRQANQRERERNPLPVLPKVEDCLQRAGTETPETP